MSYNRRIAERLGAAIANTTHNAEEQQAYPKCTDCGSNHWIKYTGPGSMAAEWWCDRCHSGFTCPW